MKFHIFKQIDFIPSQIISITSTDDYIVLFRSNKTVEIINPYTFKTEFVYDIKHLVLKAVTLFNNVFCITDSGDILYFDVSNYVNCNCMDAFSIYTSSKNTLHKDTLKKNSSNVVENSYNVAENSYNVAENSYNVAENFCSTNTINTNTNNKNSCSTNINNKNSHNTTNTFHTPNYNTLNYNTLNYNTLNYNTLNYNNIINYNKIKITYKLTDITFYNNNLYVTTYNGFLLELIYPYTNPTIRFQTSENINCVCFSNEFVLLGTGNRVFVLDGGFKLINEIVLDLEVSNDRNCIKGNVNCIKGNVNGIKGNVNGIKGNGSNDSGSLKDINSNKLSNSKIDNNNSIRNNSIRNITTDNSIYNITTDNNVYNITTDNNTNIITDNITNIITDNNIYNITTDNNTNIITDNNIYNKTNTSYNIKKIHHIHDKLFLLISSGTVYYINALLNIILQKIKIRTTTLNDIQFLNNSFFTSGEDSRLIQYKLINNIFKKVTQIDLHYGITNCLHINNNRILAGNSDGILSIISVDDNKMQYCRVYDRNVEVKMFNKFMLINNRKSLDLFEVFCGGVEKDGKGDGGRRNGVENDGMRKEVGRRKGVENDGRRNGVENDGRRKGVEKDEDVENVNEDNKNIINAAKGAPCKSNGVTNHNSNNINNINNINKINSINNINDINNININTNKNISNHNNNNKNISNNKNIILPKLIEIKNTKKQNITQTYKKSLETDQLIKLKKGYLKDILINNVPYKNLLKIITPSYVLSSDINSTKLVYSDTDSTKLIDLFPTIGINQYFKFPMYINVSVDDENIIMDGGCNREKIIIKCDNYDDVVYCNGKGCFDDIKKCCCNEKTCKETCGDIKKCCCYEKTCKETCGDIKKCCCNEKTCNETYGDIKKCCCNEKYCKDVETVTSEKTYGDMDMNGDSEIMTRETCRDANKKMNIKEINTNKNIETKSFQFPQEIKLHDLKNGTFVTQQKSFNIYKKYNFYKNNKKLKSINMIDLITKILEINNEIWYSTQSYVYNLTTNKKYEFGSVLYYFGFIDNKFLIIKDDWKNVCKNKMFRGIFKKKYGVK